MQVMMQARSWQFTLLRRHALASASITRKKMKEGESRTYPAWGGAYPAERALKYFLSKATRAEQELKIGLNSREVSAEQAPESRSNDGDRSNADNRSPVATLAPRQRFPAFLRLALVSIPCPPAHVRLRSRDVPPMLQCAGDRDRCSGGSALRATRHGSKPRGRAASRANPDQ